jgi:hypothetical protein
MGLWRNALLVNQKKIWFLTCFSNGCCNVVGGLVETALWPLSFAWKVLGGKVSPKKTQGSPQVVPGDTTESYDCAVGLLAPSQRYSMVEGEEACQT